MKKYSKLSKDSIGRFLCVSMLIIGISTLSSLKVNATTVSYNSPSYFSLTPHDPISITSDSGFAVFPGSGTIEEPYVIEGYNITTESYNGISISGTTKYFVIRNCYVDALVNGIYIDDAADGTAIVIKNTCSNNNKEGIKLYYSGSSTVANNMCNNNYYGIELSHSDGSTVINNTCSNNCKGIHLYYSGSSTVVNNTCSNNECYGIKLYESDSSTVANNTFTNCGLDIGESTVDAYLSYTTSNNWVNGKKLGFYINLDSMVIDEPVYGQLILVNCTNVTVRDQILNYASVGLSLYSCTSPIIINNTCNNNYYYGIELSHSDNSTVVNNTCNNNYYGGIWLHYISSSTVSNNTCNNNDWGIYLWDSDFCVITYNLLQETIYYGVYICYYCDNNLIQHNTFVDNNLGGTSQAHDQGTNNTWYDSATLEGNYWSDWDGKGSYPIDGPANSVDLYPLDEPIVEYSTDKTKISFTFTLLIVVVPLVLIKKFYRKRR